MADNSNSIKIRAKKISQLENLNISIDDNKDKLYLLISYKPNNDNGLNFKISFDDFINELQNALNISGINIASALSDYINDNTSTTFIDLLKSKISTESAWETAQRLNKTGGAQSEESWYDLLISKINSSVNVKGIQIDNSIDSLIVGSSYNFTASINPLNAENQNIIWTSNNTNVATVNENGLVTAVSIGQAIITAASAENINYFDNVVVNIEPSINYIFSYASENQPGIFIKNENNIIINVNINNIRNLSWTQEINGAVPTTNKNGHGFCLKDYNTTYNESYVWDDTVSTGKVWILLPKRFYDLESNMFIDEYKNKWYFLDALMKNPLTPVIDPVVINNLYEGEDYILICFSEEGQVDEQYFKKI